MDPLTLALAAVVVVKMTQTAARPFDRHPVSPPRVTSRFYRSNGAYHGAIDYGGRVAGEPGTPCVSIGHGVVAWVDATNDDDSGLNVGVRGTGPHAGWLWSYAHLDSIAVRAGQVLAPGDLVGPMGSTGTAVVHLHFSLFRLAPDGTRHRVDPLEFLPPV